MPTASLQPSSWAVPVKHNSTATNDSSRSRIYHGDSNPFVSFFSRTAAIRPAGSYSSLPGNTRIIPADAGSKPGAVLVCCGVVFDRDGQSGAHNGGCTAADSVGSRTRAPLRPSDLDISSASQEHKLPGYAGVCSAQSTFNTQLTVARFSSFSSAQKESGKHAQRPRQSFRVFARPQ